MNAIFLASPTVTLLALLVTIAAYAVALRLHHRWLWIAPIVAAALPIALGLHLLHIDYERYSHGSNLLTWLLGPATVALAVPMYRHGQALRGSLARLLLLVFLGSLVGMVSAGLTAWIFGAPLPVIASTLPKSVTTPIAIELSRELHGLPQLTVGLVILTGVLGASFGTLLLRLARVRDDRAIGAAMGTSAHGIGTASLMRHSEAQASVSSWAMAASGVITSLLSALLRFFIH